MSDADADATGSIAPVVVATPVSAERGKVASLQPADVLDEIAERYVVESTLGAGGMGVVLSARASELGRPVAVKLITADREDLRRRFEREARTTARLQHPAIVPVYGRGRVADGRPFYVMKQVSGKPLDRAIGETSTSAQRLALLPNVIAVTEAIAYAHSEGVIHRDLKPANILVGNYGETVVIDWGLAKDRADTGDEHAEASPYRGAADATAVGKVMGTPAYMPIDQARGEPLDERADVYALGAILYHLLSGRPPYYQAGETGLAWESLLARVLSKPPEPLPPEELPPDLIAIVNRAMARDRAERYASAGELAEDLRRFQTGQLVGAHRYSTWQLIRRWARRHRGPLAVAGVAMVVIVVLSVLGVRRIVEERDRAAANAEKAENLVDFMMTDLQPRLEDVGKLALFDVVADRVVKHYGEEPSMTDDQQRRYATAIQSRGSVALARGEVDKAQHELQQAVAILQPLASRDPQNAPLNQNLYRARDHLIRMQRNRGDVKGAIAAYDAMKTELMALPGPPAWMNRVAAIAVYNTGMYYQDLGDFNQAEARYRDAIALHRDTLRTNPGDDRSRELLADSLSRHAFMTMRLGQMKAAVADVDEAEAIYGALSAKSPKNASYLSGRSSNAFRRGELAEARKDMRGGADAYEEARRGFAELAALEPSNVENLDRLGATYGKLFDMNDELKNAAKRDEAMQKFIEYAELTARMDPGNDRFQRGVTLAYMRQAGALWTTKHPKDALAVFQRVLDKNATRLEKVKDPTIHSDNAYVYQQMGLIYAELKDPAAAQQALERAVAEVQGVVATQPTNLEWVSSLFVRRYALMTFLQNNGKLDEAVTMWRAASEEYERALPRDAQIDQRSNGATAWNLLAKMESKRGKHDAALTAVRHAIELRDAMVADHPKEQPVRDDRDELDGSLAEILAAAGKRAEAKQVMDGVLARVDATRSSELRESLKKSAAVCCK